MFPPYKQTNETVLSSGQRTWFKQEDPSCTIWLGDGSGVCYPKGGGKARRIGFQQTTLSKLANSRFTEGPCLKKLCGGTGDLAQWIRALSAFEDLSLDVNTQTGWPVTSAQGHLTPCLQRHYSHTSTWVFFFFKFLEGGQ